MSEEHVNHFARFLNGEIDMDELQSGVSKLSDTGSLHLDQHLFGRWLHSSFMSDGGLSLTFENYLMLGSDGYFVQSNQSFGGASFIDEFGNWSGANSFRTEVAPAERGRWSAREQWLRLDFDNQTYRAFRYEYDQNSLLLYHQSGNKLYRRA